VVINVKGQPAQVFERAALASHHVWTVATIAWPSKEIRAVGTDFDCVMMWSGGCTAQLP
jgi:hypothetical protein